MVTERREKTLYRYSILSVGITRLGDTLTCADWHNFLVGVGPQVE